MKLKDARVRQWALFVLVVIAIFVGTLAPGPIVGVAQVWIGLPYLQETAHVLLFFALGCAFPPLSQRVKAWHVLLLALFLALTTEGLQHFAVARHPSWDGVAADMAGAAIAVFLGALRIMWRRD